MVSVAIDGPSAAGKSTMARIIAEKLGFLYVDTGALYRAIALFCVRRGTNTNDCAAVESALADIEVELRQEGGKQHVYLCGEDVTEAIRVPEMSMAASNVSAFAGVREFLFELQRDIARKNNVVMDGRDIGTVVLPDATVKIFLTASAEERARRRLEEFMLAGKTLEFQAVLEDICRRDRNDMTRSIAPLKKADDGIEVDTTGNTLECSAEILLEIIREKIS